MVGILNKMIVLNYCLSHFLSRGKKGIPKNGTWFLFANELFFILLSIMVLILTRFEFRFSKGMLLFLLLAIWSISFYGTKSWFIGQLEKREIEIKFRTIQHKKLFTLMGAVIYLSSFLLFLVSIIFSFEGYLI